MNSREIEVRQKLKNDFEHYASRNLVIRTKSGGLHRFNLNQAQRYIHERLQDQIDRQGYVRAVILKGRQQGCSTYVGGRFYWRVTHNKGVRAFILTHEQEATNNLFDMTQRYHENCNPLVKPSTGAANAKELFFDLLDSGYKVGTAGSKGVGRSQTIQYFHGSEVAFWPFAETHAAGVMQAIPNQPGTEIILESTANGIGNFFHQQWQAAERGEGDYIAIFVPWFWQEEYRKPCPDGFTLTDLEMEYQALYSLTREQICWRREKIAQLGSEWLFKQEYPSNPAEAFQVSGDDTLISAEIVMKARKATVSTDGPLVIGVDPARYGDDRTSIIMRCARHAFGKQSFQGKDTMEVAGIVKTLIDSKKPAAVFVDVGGLGAGVVDV